MEAVVCCPGFGCPVPRKEKQRGWEGRSGTVATMLSPEAAACSTDSVIFPLAQAAGGTASPLPPTPKSRTNLPGTAS